MYEHVKTLLCKTTKTSIVRLSWSKFECGDKTVGLTKLQPNADYQNLLDGYPVDSERCEKKHKYRWNNHPTYSLLYTTQKPFVTALWGYKLFQLVTSGRIILSKVYRNVSPKDMWKSYQGTIQNKKSDVGISIFYYLVHDLTVLGRGVATSVNYVRTSFDCSRAYQSSIEIIIYALILTLEKKQLTQYLSAKNTYLKYRCKQKWIMTVQLTIWHTYVLRCISKFDNMYQTDHKGMDTRNIISPSTYVIKKEKACNWEQY